MPLRRLFFDLANYILGFLVTPMTWFILFSLGKDPIIDGENIFIEGHKLIIGSNCLGADNLYFVLSTLIIYSCIFRLKKIKNLGILLSLSITISIAINIIRNTILALIFIKNIL